MLSGTHGGHVEGTPDVSPTAPGGASTPMNATIPVQRSDTDKGGDLPAVKGAEFGESADEGEGGYGAYTRDILEEVVLGLPEGVGVNEVVYFSVQVEQFLGEELDVLMEPGEKGFEGPLDAKGLGGSHVDKLLSTGEEGLEMGGLRVWEGTSIGSEGKGKAGYDVGVDCVGLGQLAGGACEVPDLPGVHNGCGYLMYATLQGQGPLQATGGLHDDEGDIEVLGQLKDISDAFSVVSVPRGLVLWEDVQIQEATADVDTHDRVLAHVIPFLQVRVVDPGNCTGLNERGVRWPMLKLGLEGP